MKKNIITEKWHGKRIFLDKQHTTYKTLVDSLREINEKYNIIGTKQSFEDEGAHLDDIVMMRRITELCGLSSYVKIGGCEANTDINNCVNIGIDNLIGPMIETEYSFKKFISSVRNIENTNFYFLCETRTAHENLEKILETEESELLSGVIVGRSDFTKSFGLEKKDVDSDFIMSKVENVFVKCKERGLKTTMGGNISYNSSKHITNLYRKNLLDKIESRNIVMELNDQNIRVLDQAVDSMLAYEIKWLNFKATNYNSIYNSYLDRINILEKRLNEQ